MKEKKEEEGEEEEQEQGEEEEELVGSCIKAFINKGFISHRPLVQY